MRGPPRPMKRMSGARRAQSAHQRGTMRIAARLAGDEVERLHLGGTCFCTSGRGRGNALDRTCGSMSLRAAAPAHGDDAASLTIVARSARPDTATHRDLLRVWRELDCSGRIPTSRHSSRRCAADDPNDGAAKASRQSRPTLRVTRDFQYRIQRSSDERIDPIRCAEQVKVIWHDDVAADEPCRRGMPCTDDC